MLFGSRLPSWRYLAGVALAASISVSLSAHAASSVLQQGVMNFNRGYVQKAIPFFEKAAQQAPGDEQTQLWLARAYAKQGLQDKSSQAYARVLSINPNNVEALGTLGEMESWHPETRAAAIEKLRRAQGLRPNDVSINKKLADALFWNGQAEEAYTYAQLAAPSLGGDKKWLASYAQILTQSGHPEQALSVYENYLNITESRDLAQLQAYALALNKAGQTARAQQVYESIKPYALQLGPDQGVEIKKSMGALAFDLGLYNDAVTFDQSLPAEDQAAKTVQLRMARALMRAGRNPEAVDVFYRQYQLGQLNADEKVEFGDFLNTLNLNGQALPEENLIEALYLSALRDEPDNVDAALRLAEWHRMQAVRNPMAFRSAAQYYQQAVQIAEQSAPTRRDEVKRAYLEFLTSMRGEAESVATVDQIFQELVAQNPGDYDVRGAYGEFLSYQDTRRPDAIRVYMSLIQEDTARQDDWKDRLDKVLSWHKPTTALIPLYQELVNTFPEDKTIWLSVARAYASDPAYRAEALDLYTRMTEKFPDDATIRREWIGQLLADEKRRPEALRILEQYTAAHPDDLDAKVAYGRLLSYQRNYRQSLAVLDEVIAQNPDHKDALVAKGYTLLWSGRKLEGKQHFVELMERFMDDNDVAIGLAQANKFLGRYDEAFEVMKRIRPQINMSPALPRTGIRLVSHEQPALSALEKLLQDAGPVWDVGILPAAPQARQVAFAPVPEMDATDAPPVPMAAPAVPEPVPAMLMQAPSAEVPKRRQTADLDAIETIITEPEGQSDDLARAPRMTPEQAALQSDIESLNAAIESLKYLQQVSGKQLQALEDKITASNERITAQVSVQDAQGEQNNGFRLFEMGEELAVFTSLGYDTNPLLSGLGRFRNSDLIEMERGLTNDLRPMIRGGFDWITKSGEDTTTKLRGWGFPNQIALSLTSQVRARFAFNPYRYYIPGGPVSPNKTWAHEYYGGLTAKVTDKLLLDGEMSITHFTQSDSNNINYNAFLAYDFNDRWRAKIGSARYPQFNSLLNLAGLRPSVGAFAGSTVGQSRETTVYGEINWNPNPNVDVNLGYEWGYIDGRRTPDNFKNQVFFSPGYTWYYAQDHKLRLGLESLFMNYSKNTSAGFFDTTTAGFRVPVASLDPAVRAASGFDFGGYFSPLWFFQNAGRVDLRGSFRNKLIEYKLGGSLGVQTFGQGHGIRPGNQTAMTASADLNIITNFTDWLAAYVYGEYLNAGVVFTRWRFGGGLIFRPKIDAISPVFGGGGGSGSGSGASSSSSSSSSSAASPSSASFDPPSPTGADGSGF